MLLEPIELSEDFHEVLDQLEMTHDHLFITGRAGTGKSTLLQVFRKSTQKKSVVLAPTGVAALNVRGQTIHSFFGFPPRLLSAKDIKKSKMRHLFNSLEVLVIDEISMVRADLLDHIDLTLRFNRDIDRPFGGVQMVFFGDLFQLPPVVATPFEQEYFRTIYDSPYFFSAKVLKEFTLHTIELHQVYRQEEKRFVDLLDCIRRGDIDEDILEELNERVNEDLDEDQAGAITLTARNHVAKAINTKALQVLPSSPHVYRAKVTGQFNPRLYPTEVLLILRIGAQVMFIKNDPAKRYVNGTIGKIVNLNTDRIVVQISHAEGKKEIEVPKEEWEILKYKRVGNTGDIAAETIGSFIQYPLKLAWAVTIHKSQGKTFDQVEIDLGRGAFEHGQAYVALSRCRTLKGIKLKNPIRYRDILIDERIIDYYQQTQR
ncbi:MAG: AAA family ATPase [Saprospiraceae bacterium]|nr:AAA family ATPase [Saprospiraceae bacterium]